MSVFLQWVSVHCFAFHFSQQEVTHTEKERFHFGRTAWNSLGGVSGKLSRKEMTLTDWNGGYYSQAFSFPHGSLP